MDNDAHYHARVHVETSEFGNRNVRQWFVGTMCIVYQDSWDATIGEQVPTIGRVPKKISSVCFMFLLCGGIYNE